MNATPRRWNALVALASLWTTAAWAAPTVEDGRKISSSLTLRVGETRLYNYVNLAAISDDKVLSILVDHGLLTLKARKPGMSFLWIFPMPPGRGRPAPAAMAGAVQAGAKKRITVKVTPY